MWPRYAMDRNHLNNFERGSTKDHSCKNWSKSNQWFRRRCCLKIVNGRTDGRTDGRRRRRTVSDHNTSPWAFGSGELKIKGLIVLRVCYLVKYWWSAVYLLCKHNTCKEDRWRSNATNTTPNNGVLWNISSIWALYFLKRRLSLKTLLNVRQAKTAYGLNEKVIASAVSKSRKGYFTEDMIFFCLFFSLSSDNASCQVKNKMANHMALNSHDMSWNSFLHTCIIYLLQTEFHSCCSHSTCWYRSFSVQLSPKILNNMVGIDPSWIRTKYLISLMDTSL